MIKTVDNNRALTFVKFEPNEREEYEKYCDSLINKPYYPYKVVEELIDGNDVILTFANDVGNVIKVRIEAQKDIKVAENGLNEELEASESDLDTNSEENTVATDGLESDSSGLLIEE